jgi:hypothetical protein
MNVRFRHRNKTYGRKYYEFIGHTLDCDICIVEDLACCSNHSVNTLDNLIYNIDNAIAEMGKELLYFELYGYKIKECKDLNKYIQLKTQREAIKKHMIAMIKNASTCFKCNELEVLIENVKKVLGHECTVFIRTDINIDSSNKTEWDVNNPYCVSREKWEELAYRVCGDLGFNLEIIDLSAACEITFNTVITPQLCDIIADIKVEKQNCDITSTLTLEEEKCELDYNLLVSSTNCNVSYSLYKELLSCNLTSKIIREVYDCDMSLKINKENPSCAILVTVTGMELNLCDFNIETQLNNPNC